MNSFERKTFFRKKRAYICFRGGNRVKVYFPIGVRANNLNFVRSGCSESCFDKLSPSVYSVPIKFFIFPCGKLGRNDFWVIFKKVKGVYLIWIVVSVLILGAGLIIAKLYNTKH